MTKTRFPIFSSDDPSDEQGVMSFGEHLDELRARLIYALVVPVPLFIVFFFFSGRLMLWLLEPLFRAQASHDLLTQVQSLSPPEVIVTQLKISIIAAIVVTIPWILWQFWLFIRPGLMREERRFVHFLVPGSAILTFAGVVLFYYIMLPLMLQVLIAFGSTLTPRDAGMQADSRVEALIEADQPLRLRAAPPTTLIEGDAWIEWPDMDLWYVQTDARSGELQPTLLAPPQPRRISQEYRVSWYISFVLVLLLAMVIAFQMPLVLVVLGWVGLATPQWLRSQRRNAVIVCALVSAVITPADAVSMVLMLIPLYALFELGIVLMMLAPAKRVAEGTVLGPRSAEDAVPRTSGRSGFDPDNRSTDSSDPGAYTDESAQTDSSTGQSKSTGQSDSSSTDEGKGPDQ